MGADQSWFKLKCFPVNETDQSIQQNFSVNEEKKSLVKSLFHKVNNLEEKVVLLSDCYIEREKYDGCPFASISTAPFRYIAIVNQQEDEKPKEGEKFYLLKGAELKLKKSDEYRTLLKKGSVLYVNSKSEKQGLINYLKSNQAFYQIGYNYAI